MLATPPLPGGIGCKRTRLFKAREDHRRHGGDVVVVADDIIMMTMATMMAIIIIIISSITSSSTTTGIGIGMPMIGAQGRLSRGPSLRQPESVRSLEAGHEALSRFVANAPLRKTHECVFGILALESEPIDPRL